CVEYVARGVSGTKDRRPALDRLVADARRRKFDVLLCWRLDRLGRNLRHLVGLREERRAGGGGVLLSPLVRNDAGGVLRDAHLDGGGDEALGISTGRPKSRSFAPSTVAGSSWRRTS